LAQVLKLTKVSNINLLSFTYTVLTTSQPDYPHNLISVQSIQVELAPHLLSPYSSTIRIFVITNHLPLF